MAYNTILLKGDFGRRYDEKLADGSITPGMLMYTTSADKYKAHATSGGIWDRSIAVEDSLQGKDGVNTKGNTIDDAYTDATLVRAITVEPGDEVYALIAAGQNVALGAELMSNGAGAVTAKTSTNHVVGWAAEAKDNSGGGSPVRIRMKVR